MRSPQTGAPNTREYHQKCIFMAQTVKDNELNTIGLCNFLHCDRQLVSWSLTSLFSTNMAISETSDRQLKHKEIQVAQLPQRDRANPKSVEILSAAAQLYEKSHLTRRIALSCAIKISPVGSLD